MPIIYGDSYGNYEQNRQANEGRIASNYFNSLAANRAVRQQQQAEQDAANRDALQWASLNQRGQENALSNTFQERQLMDRNRQFEVNLGLTRDDVAQRNALARDRFGLDKAQFDYATGPEGRVAADSGRLLNSAVNMLSVKGVPAEEVEVGFLPRLTPSDALILKATAAAARQKQQEEGMNLVDSLNQSYGQIEKANPAKPYNALLGSEPWVKRYKENSGVDPVTDPNFMPELALSSARETVPWYRFNGDEVEKSASDAIAKAIAAAAANRRTEQGQIAQQFMYDNRRAITPDVQTSFDESGRPSFSLRRTGQSQPSINPTARSPYPDGTRLQRKDGSIYVVKNGQPVLE